MDVQAGCGGFTGEFAEALDELFLEVIGDVVLGTEENYTSLRDWLVN